MKSFKITIIDNESGEVILNNDNALAIIGAVTNGEGTETAAFARCNGEILLNALIGADKAMESIFGKEPIAKMMYMLYKLKVLGDTDDSESAIDEDSLQP